jgi:hypothetical protein
VFVIFGWGWRTRYLDAPILTCPRCDNHVAHPRSRQVLKISLFFVPLIPLRTRYVVQCTTCGVTREVPA